MRRTLAILASAFSLGIGAGALAQGYYDGPPSSYENPDPYGYGYEDQYWHDRYHAGEAERHALEHGQLDAEHEAAHEQEEAEHARMHASGRGHGLGHFLYHLNAGRRHQMEHRRLDAEHEAEHEQGLDEHDAYHYGR